jgi:hypothetical protein
MLKLSNNFGNGSKIWPKWEIDLKSGVKNIDNL